MADFAAGLRQLRQHAGGLGYRELSRRAHYSPTTLADAARGERLPSLAVTLAYVRACGGETDEWAARWRAVVTQQTSAAAEEDAPYLGLRAFQAADANLFFGREQLTAELTAKISAQRFTAVFGASGVGKSSLLRAGLAPRLSRVVVMTPGQQPIQECATWLADITGAPAEQVVAELTADPRGMDRMLRSAFPGAEDELVLVVDQFEEVFTRCAQEADRATFIAMLTRVTDDQAGPVRVVLGVRADFAARCAEYPELATAMRHTPVSVGSLSQEELRQAIISPARERGYLLEGVLLTAIAADAAGQPGALPLVSRALLETWRRRRGNTLTLTGYQAAGGIDGALADMAERTYTALTDDQQRAARDLFLRLTTFGDGTEHTRRRLSRAELAPAADALLDLLATARLITLAETTVELAHEALIRAWPRLAHWLADDRGGLRTHRQLTEAAHTWQTLDRDDGALYRGTRLGLARRWATDQHPDLTSVEREFLDTSTRHATAEHAAAVARKHVRRYLVAGLAVLLVIATGLGVVAWQQRADVVAMHHVAVSRQVADRALAMRSSQPDTAALLSAAAFGLSPTAEARGALLSTTAGRAYQADLLGHTDAVSRAEFTRDGNMLATVSRDRTLILWDVANRTRIARLTDHDAWLRSVALSPDSQHAVTGGDDNTVAVWHIPRRTRTTFLTGHHGRVRAMVFSPDGTTLITADDTGTILFWETNGWTRTAAATVPGALIRTMAVSQDGRTLAIAVDDGRLVLWDLPSGTVRRTVDAHSSTVADVTISPDGTLVATAGHDGTVGLWRLADGVGVARLTGHTDQVRTVEFTEDGRSLITAGIDHTIMLWDTRLRIARARLTGLTHNVYALAVHPRTGLVATAGEDRKVVLWDPAKPSLVLAGDADSTGDITYSPDGRLLVTATGTRAMVWDARTRAPLAILPATMDTVIFSPDSRLLASAGGDRLAIDLWDTRRFTRVAVLTGPEGPVLDLAFNTDGSLLAAGAVDGLVHLWDVKRRANLATLDGHTGPVNGVAFSPDSQTLATAGHDELVMLWDVSLERHLHTLPGHAGWVRNIIFSPDGRTLASASIDRTIRLWDVASRRATAVLSGHTDAASGVAFSADGRLLAFTSDDRTVTLWDVGIGAITAKLTGHTAKVDAIAFSPDSGTLASVGLEQTAILWHTGAEASVEELCASLARDLTAEEWDRTIPDVDQFPVCPPP
ncbi:nSTAND1 domain-containing NTPase [Actinophytocola sediminis]